MTRLTGSYGELMRLPNASTAVNIVPMRSSCNKPSLAILLGSLASVWLLVGCSASSPTPQKTPADPSVGQTTSEPELPNMDELESDSSVHLFSSEEDRARDLSELWLRHAHRLGSSSPGASIAAYLRAAHTSLTALTSDNCADLFNETCAELRGTYERALSATVAAFRANSWRPIDLSPTRYRVVLATAPEQITLQSLAVELSDDDHTGHGRRSGVGSEAVGCVAQQSAAQLPRSVDSCAPLTFVLSFNTPLSSERTTATLTAHDASRQAVVDLQGRELSLAADFGLSLDQLAARAVSDRQRRLFCIGTPSPSETTLIAAAHQSSIAKVRDMLLAVLLDPSLEAHNAVCLFPLRDGESPDRAARALSNAARSIADEQALRSLVPSPVTVFLVAEGDDGNEAASALLSRIKRAPRQRPRSRAAGALRVRGVYSLASAKRQAPLSEGVAARLQVEAASLGVPASGPAFDGHPRTRAEQYREIRKLLAAAPEPTQSDEASGNNAATDELQPLKLSPVF